MRARVLSRPAVLAAALCAAAAGLAACGGGGSGQTTPRQPETVVADASAFPQAGGKSLEQLAGKAPPGRFQLAPSVGTIAPGKDRVGFALFNAQRQSLEAKQVALYVADSATAPARGPYPATWRSLKVKPAYQSRTTRTDPDSAASVYTAEVPFGRARRQYVFAVIRRGSGFEGTAGATPFRVSAKSAVPAVGDRAPVVDTPTKASAGGLEQIETRVPPDTMHDLNLRDALGNGKPTVLIFATPALCQSRVCGPVVDIAEQVKAATGDKASFIHMEIYNQNEVSKGFRPQLRAYGLPSEPWAFVIGRDGRIVARFEGAFSAQELQQAVDSAIAQQ